MHELVGSDRTKISKEANTKLIKFSVRSSYFFKIHI